MRDEFFWSTLVLVWVFGWAAVWLVRQRAREAKALKLREMLHRERMAAIEGGVPLPELPDPEEAPSEWLSLEADQVRAAWLRRIALEMAALR